MRKASKQVIHSLRRAAKEHPGWSAERQEGSAAHAVQLLVGETCQVIANLQEVSLHPLCYWGFCSWGSNGHLRETLRTVSAVPALCSCRRAASVQAISLSCQQGGCWT